MAKHPAVVSVKCPASGGVTDWGTGTLIDCGCERSFVITNNHVVRDVVGNPIVIFPNGSSYYGDIIKTDKVWDLALVEIIPPGVPGVKLAGETPKLGERLTIIGYGARPDDNYREASGPLVGWAMPMNNPNSYFMNIGVAARNGDSGGPILNEKGELSGVLWGSNGETSGTYCGQIQTFLRSCGLSGIKQ